MSGAAGVLLDAGWWIAALFVAVQLVTALVNAWAFPRLPPPSRRGSEKETRVSILVPVRDEAATLPTTLPALLAQGAHEVVVLDDRSSDGTGALLADAARAHPSLRVLRGAPLEHGWNGKNWACRQLADAAEGDLWVFTDADVRWHDGTLASLLTAWRRHRPGLLTVWPKQRTESWFERIAVPQVDMILLGALPHPLVRLLPIPSLAAANGQLMAWTPDAYRRVGGHASVRAEVLEDVRLAQRAKRLGVKLHLALGGDRISTRMYRSAEETIDGFAKNVLAAAGSPIAAILLVAVGLLAYLLAWPLALLEPRWLLVAVGGLALRGLVAATVGRSPIEAALQPAAPLAAAAVVVRALRRRGGYVWRGRSYPPAGRS